MLYPLGFILIRNLYIYISNAVNYTFSFSIPVFLLFVSTSLLFHEKQEQANCNKINLFQLKAEDVFAIGKLRFYQLREGQGNEMQVCIFRA